MRWDPGLWISLAIIVALGTLGGLLFKLGTNKIGIITLSRFLEVDLTFRSLAHIALLLLGFGVFLYSGLSLRAFSFAAYYIFSPIIFAALATLALSRFLVGVPLSVAGLGRVTAVITALGVASTAVASSLVFKEAMTPRVVLGIALVTVGVILIGQEF